MKNQLKNIITAYMIGASVTTVTAKNDISNLFKTGMSDLNTVANGYLLPAGKSFSSGQVSDWYNTAEVHSTLGFDVALDAGVVFIPSRNQLFQLANLSNLKPTDPTISTAPTFGGNGKGVELNLMQPKYLIDGILINPLWNNGTGKISSFTTPDGVSKYIPTASVRVTIGLPFVNDLSVRFTPKVSVSGFESSMWGVGVKHNFKQWLPLPSMLPFDAAILFSYSKMNLKYAFPLDAQITPTSILGSGLEYTPDFQLNLYSTQAMKVEAAAITANVIVSKQMSFVTTYLGMGVSKTSSELTMVGIYPTIRGVVPVITGTSVVAKMQIENVTNPIQINTSEITPNLTIGVRLKAAFTTVHMQYTLQKYPVASAGFGVTFK